jgi:signal transduction histidine kinase
MQDLRRVLATVRAIATASQGRDPLPKLLYRLCREVSAGFGFDRVGISRLDGDVTVPLAGHGIPEDVIHLRPRLDESPLLALAHDRGELVYVSDARREPSLAPELVETYGLASMFALPLMSEGRCIGFLVGDRAGSTFELAETEVDILNTIGALAATLLEKELLREELHRLDETKTQFIELASHELRSPIQTVYGVLATLHARGGELREEQRVELRAAAYVQADRLRRLADQLLDLSRLDAETVSIVARTVHVRRKIEEVVLLVAEQRAQEIEIAIQPNLEAQVDEHVLERIVSNLVTNALRHGELPISLSAERHDRHFRLRVEDHGRGVPPDFEPLLFERFTRSEEAQSDVPGTGLGLSIARAFARAHGGELLYRSGDGGGACFEFVVPQPNDT